MLPKPNHRWDSETNPSLQCQWLELCTATVLPNKHPYSLCAAQKLRTFLCWKKKICLFDLELHQHTYTHTHTDTDRRFCWYDKCCDCWRMPDFLLLIRASHCKNCGSYIFNLITSSDFAGLIRVYIRGVNFGCVCMIVFEKRVAVNLQTNTHPFAEKLCVEFLKISDK